MGEVLVGTASWTDKSLLSSGWYPPDAKTAEGRLRYYAEQFPLVEVDSTYYFPPSEDNAERWAERTPPEFTFNIKAFSLLTKHPTRPDAIYKDLGVRSDKKSVYLDDLDAEIVDRVWDRFLSALRPLDEAGKLGLLLFQFPPWFVIGRASKQYLLECARRADPYRICVEFRNKTWLSEGNRKETIEFLEGHGLPLVCVDMPQGFTSSLPPLTAATADIAVVRFHGRNADEWESGSVQRRFKYLYNKEELEQWVPKISALEKETERTHVLMNNCFRDYAQRNASELSRLLTSHSPA
jgi:uncharacterized protein YecE (DUF72 family)